jgi:hypothetical protein
MESPFGEDYKQELASGGRLVDLHGFQSWFALHKRASRHTIHRSFVNLNAFPHVQGWRKIQLDHNVTRDAFSRHLIRA